QVAGLIQASNRAAQVQETQVHPSAVVAQTAKLGQRVRISAGVVIEEGAEIGDDTDIGPGCVIGAHSRIGAAGLLHARVSLGAGVQIGQRVVIQSGAVLGSDGFGYAPNADRHWVKIPQVGGVVIGDDVEIGANTVIDQGTMSPTRIGHGVKLDNLIQVAHNVEIGDHTAIAGCVGIAGSAKIGRYCQIGGAAGILGHLQIADGTIIGPMSLVMSSIETAGKYVGVMPLAPERQWEKSAAIIRRLPEMRRSLSRLGQVVGLQRDPTTDA
ncbi:MAG: UDP-3-O-(3-hydroxymyristoyl)glucosamine N-acyltransferase, partial [Burkholderiaceae bacterium]